MFSLVGNSEFGFSEPFILGPNGKSPSLKPTFSLNYNIKDVNSTSPAYHQCWSTERKLLQETKSKFILY